MGEQAIQASVVSADLKWRVECVSALLKAGCDVHTARSGFRGLNLVKKHVYDIIVFDDSFSDITPIEFFFNLRELTYRNPLILVAGSEIDRFAKIWDRGDVFLASSQGAVSNALQDAVGHVRAQVT